MISSAAIPAPVEDSYGGLEAITGWLTLEFAKSGHDVTLITTKGSNWEGDHPIMNDGKQIANMRVIGTVEPSWSGNAEIEHYKLYKDVLEKEFCGPDAVVVDHTWWPHAYEIKQKKYPEMNLLHVHHGMVGFTTPPPVLHPRLLGLSREHAYIMNKQLNIPVRFIHNGIPLVPFEEGYDPQVSNKGDYLLSLNRISSEKGIENCIDIAVATNTPIKIVGDDTKVADQSYVNDIIERCRHSNGLAQYYGLVDNGTKNNLLLNCKALIAAPKYPWIEAFGLYAIEANAYYKPVLSLANGGLRDIIHQGMNGYLADTPEELKQFVPKIDDINPVNCRDRVEQSFTKEIMARNHLSLFQQIIDKDPTSYW